MKKLLLPLLLFLMPLVGVANPFGASATYANAALTATLVVAQSTPGLLTYYNISNSNSSTVFIQYFDASTTAGITLGSTSPKGWISVPSGNGVTDAALPFGIAFANGIVIAVTTTPTGNTAPSSSVPVVLGTN
jgi:hypothetical protein